MPGDHLPVPDAATTACGGPGAVLLEVMSRRAVSPPVLLLDPDAAVAAYRALAARFPGADIWYAVKCNPHPALLSALAAAGCGFEAASAEELAVLGELGVDLAGVPYTNPVRPRADLARSLSLGCRTFMLDSPGELDKIAAEVTAQRVDPAEVSLVARLAVPGGKAVYDLSGKFGCDLESLAEIAIRARWAGLAVAGLSFHVGSQTRDPSAWVQAVRVAAAAARVLARCGEAPPRLLDVGGGFPAAYRSPVEPPEVFAGEILGEVARHPELARARLALEPGRCIAAPAGYFVTTVIGVARRGGRRWVHLDVGVYNGLVEARELQGHDAYPLEILGADRVLAPAVLTGPTCDSADVVAEEVLLPVDLAEGELIGVAQAGAYSTSVATSFNGFAPPPVWIRESNTLNFYRNASPARDYGAPGSRQLA